MAVRRLRLLLSLTVIAFSAVVAAATLTPATAQASFIVYTCGVDLCRVDPAGASPRRITTDGTSVANYQWPSVSRDGRRMSWLRGNDLMIGDAGAVPSGGPLARTVWFDVIRPDGKQVAALVLSSVFYGLYAYIYDEAGGVVMSGPEPDQYAIGWAADNQHLLLPWQNPDSAGTGICVAVPNPVAGWDCGTRVASAPGVYMSDPAVSPDGRTLAVTILDGDGAASGHIALYDYASGALIRNLTSGTNDALPAWSPDGSALVFQRGTALYTIPAGGAPGGERLLVSSGQTPSWGGPVDDEPDGAPETVIKKATINEKRRRVRFTFTGSGGQTPLQFRCELDGASSKQCASPASYRHLREGRHVFKVWAVDSQGRTDPTPAKKRFKI